MHVPVTRVAVHARARVCERACDETLIRAARDRPVRALLGPYVRRQPIECESGRARTRAADSPAAFPRVLAPLHRVNALIQERAVRAPRARAPGRTIDRQYNYIFTIYSCMYVCMYSK